jgi:LAO/AO transport system kinase
LEEMVHRREGPTKGLETGHHGFDAPEHPDDPKHPDDSEGAEGDGSEGAEGDDGSDAPEWTPEVLRTVANTGGGVDDLIAAFDAHAAHLRESGEIEAAERRRYAEEIRTLVRSDVGALAADEIERRGGIDRLAEAVRKRETDPYSVAAEVLAPIVDCVEPDEG